MKYGTTLIVLAIINSFTIFSGLPSGWKKGIIVITSIFVVLIGWIVRSIAQKKLARTRKRVRAIETELAEPLIEVVEELAEDVVNKVEKDIHDITYS